MTTRCTTLGLENLESRLNLSSTASILVPSAPALTALPQDQLRWVSQMRLTSLTTKDSVVVNLDGSSGGGAASRTGAIATPTAVSATVVSNGVKVSWTDRSTNETNMLVLRSTDGVNYTRISKLGKNASSIVDTTVQAGTTYYYTVQATNKRESSTYATPAVVTTPSLAAPTPVVTAPDAPNGLAITATTNTATLSWHDQSTDELGFLVYRSTDGANFTVVADLSTDTTSWVDTSVSESTQYWYVVSAWNSVGESASAISSITTESSTPAPAPAPAPTPIAAPSSPTSLAATTTTSSVSLTWADNSDTEDGTHVYRSTDGTNFSQVADLTADTTSWTDTAVSSSTKYWYRVGEYNAGGENPSSTITATTATPITIPNSPSTLTATTTTTSVSLKWKDNASNETGFHVYRSTDGTNFALVATLGTNATAYTDSSLASGTTFQYKVGAYNSAGEWTTSALTATTAAAAPAAATNLNATTTSNSVALTWTDNATNEQGVKVYRSTNGTNFTVVTTLGAGATSWTDSTVAASTKYWYKLGEYNTGGETASATITATTAAPVVMTPAAPTNLAATTTASSVSLTWTDNSNNDGGFKVYRSTDGTNYSVVVTTATNATGWTDSNVASGTTYYYMITALNNYGESGTAKTTATTESLAPAPAPILPATPDAPTHLAATTSTSAVSLTWTDNADNEGGFRIYRSTDGTNYSVVNTAGINATSWTDTTVASGTTYYYMITALNNYGESASAKVTAITESIAPAPTPTPTPAPAAATNLAASATTNAVALTWTDNATNEQGVKVYRSTDGTNYTLATTLGAGATSWTDTTVAASTKYWYKLGEYNTGGETASSAVSVTTATPAPLPSPSPTPTSGVTFKTQNMTSFNELVISGTSGNNSILVTQSNGVLTITADGVVTTFAATFGDIKIYGEAGNDTLTVDSSVNIATLIYGGDGADTIKALGSGKMTIVDLDTSVNVVTGNGINTSFWVNTGDTVTASAAETAAGGVNRVASFFQGVSRTLNGANLTDPTDSGATIRLANSSFWGTGPTKDDVNQTGIADCYYLAGLSAMAYTMPAKLQNMGVDLGDGTYAVRYVRNGVTTFVRVDADLAAGGNAYGLKNSTPGANGNQWQPLFEKAYAFFRSGANTYASLAYGSASTALKDAGINATAVTASSLTAASLETLIKNSLNSGKPIIANSLSAVGGGAPIVASHSYTVIGTYRDASGQLMIQLRNPWGNDGISDGSNFSDAIVTVSYTQFTAAFSSVSYMV